MGTQFQDAVAKALARARPDSAFAEALANVKQKHAKKQGYKGVVTNSEEFMRIRNLPARELDLENVTDLTSIFAKPGGTMKLRPIQSAALLEANHANGLFGPIGVGQGKTLLTLLMPEAMDSERTVLLVPPQLRKQLAREIDEVYGLHFNLPLERIVRILSYSELSLAKNSGLLEELDPDLIIADECHNLRARSSARTKRFLRYMRENPHCRFVALSGTMTTRSILDYAHLLELALRKNSPLPVGYQELQLWAGALDVNPPKPVDPGVLKVFLEPEDEGNIRISFRRRLTSTPGVVATEKDALGTSLLVKSIQPPEVPASIVDALEEVRNTWAYNGEEFSTPIAYWRFCRQMSNGFYYRWVWPEGKPTEEDIEWLEARAAWKREMREKLKTAGTGMDSELLLTNAAERWRKQVEDHSECNGEFHGLDHSKCKYKVWVPFKKGSPEWYAAIGYDDDEESEDFEPGRYETKCIHYPDDPDECTGEEPEFNTQGCVHYPSNPKYCTGKKSISPGGAKTFACEEYVTWKKVKDRYNPTPPTEPVIVSLFVVFDAIERAKEYVKKKHKVIIWYSHKVIGDILAEHSGFPHFGAGTDASSSKEDVIICSVDTQATGKNLQHYDTNIITAMPTNGKLMEQLLGRTHRPGQESDLVIADYYDHTESLDKCMNDVIADAMYIQDSTGQRQKILYADGEGIHRKRIEIQKHQQQNKERENE